MSAKFKESDYNIEPSNIFDLISKEDIKRMEKYISDTEHICEKNQEYKALLWRKRLYDRCKLNKENNSKNGH